MFNFHPPRLGLVAAGLLLVGFAHPCSAQPLPQTITFVVSFAPGGVADVIARLVAQKLGDQTGQKVVVENRAGAGGNLAARTVANAAPDGATFLVTTSALAVNDTAARNKGYNTEDLRAVTIAASTADVLAVHPSNPAKDLGELVKNARDKSINYGTAGVGTSPHIAAEYFFREIAKVKAVHVPFTGGPPAVAAVVGNHIDVYAGAMPSAVGQIRDGLLRGIGLAGPNRSSALPNVPTYAETGFPDFYSIIWVGFFAPAKTPDEIVVRLNNQINEILKEPEAQQKLRGTGFDPIIQSHAEATTQFKNDVASWGKMVRAIGLSSE
jgi:tripartite-type tricarboxylate transporter receptor subunit TctC